MTKTDLAETAEDAEMVEDAETAKEVGIVSNPQMDVFTTFPESDHNYSICMQPLQFCLDYDNKEWAY